MVGVPGSGKSTLTKKCVDNLKLRHGDVINPDSIRERITGAADIFTHEAQVWALVHQRVAHAARTNRPCVLDATGANVALRRKMISYMHSLGAKVHAIWVQVSLETALTRNAMRDRVVPTHVIEKMWNSLAESPPTRFDGFDVVHVVNND